MLLFYLFFRVGVSQEVEQPEKGGNKVVSKKTVKSLPLPEKRSDSAENFHPGSLTGFGRLESDVKRLSSIERSTPIGNPQTTQKKKTKSKMIISN